MAHCRGVESGILLVVSLVMRRWFCTASRVLSFQVAGYVHLARQALAGCFDDDSVETARYDKHTEGCLT